MRYSLAVVLHITAICVLSVLGYVCLTSSLWFSATACAGVAEPSVAVDFTRTGRCVSGSATMAAASCSPLCRRSSSRSTPPNPMVRA